MSFKSIGTMVLRSLGWLFLNVFMTLLQVIILLFILWGTEQKFDWNKILENCVLMFLSVALLSNTLFHEIRRKPNAKSDRTAIIGTAIIYGLVMVMTICTYSLGASYEISGHHGLSFTPDKLLVIQCSALLLTIGWCMLIDLRRA